MRTLNRCALRADDRSDSSTMRNAPSTGRALKFERALPSTYQLFFDAPGANVTDADVASVTLARDVAELQVSDGSDCRACPCTCACTPRPANQSCTLASLHLQLLGKIMPSELRPLAVSIGEPLSAQPRVRVLDKLGRPLVGKRVVALSTAPIFEDYTFAFLHVSALPPLMRAAFGTEWWWCSLLTCGGWLLAYRRSRCTRDTRTSRTSRHCRRTPPELPCLRVFL